MSVGTDAVSRGLRCQSALTMSVGATPVSRGGRRQSALSIVSRPSTLRLASLAQGRPEQGRGATMLGATPSQVEGSELALPVRRPSSRSLGGVRAERTCEQRRRAVAQPGAAGPDLPGGASSDADWLSGISGPGAWLGAVERSRARRPSNGPADPAPELVEDRHEAVEGEPSEVGIADARAGCQLTAVPRRCSGQP
jgi:hypothetical protein